MKKRIAFLLLIVCALFALASCKLFSKDKNNGDGGGSAINKDDCFWAEGVDIKMIFAEDSTDAADRLTDLIYEKTGTVAGFRLDSQAETPHEIIVGKSTREISVKAYQLLDREIEAEGMAGYLIYTNGTSVAIAYSTADVLDLAIDAFAEKCLGVSGGVIALSKGTLAKSAFDLYEYFDRCDAALRESQWQALENHINDKGYDGKATVAAFKQLYSLYSDDAYIWLANLYDPITGGFYYSNSARETITFAPDLESTRQALDLLRYSGMTTDLKGTLPEDMKTNLVAWVQSLQRSNGYFYHPQWDNYVTTDERLGRDVTNARSILAIFGARPNYAAYTGGSGVVTASLLPGRLVSSKPAAVSKVVPAAASHLSSEEAFLEYLNKQNWNDSYTSGNRLAAQFTLIREAGLADVCLDFLDGIQNSETGMWSPNRDDDAVNGFLKISAMYAEYGRMMNYMSEAADTCIAVLLSDADPSTVCWVYNVWYSLGNIIGLLNSKNATAEDKALARDIRDRLCKNAAEYITVAYEKYAPFRKDDGSFSFTPNFSSNASQGMPVCVSRMNEGDVNATYISIISITGRIFSALGYKDAEVTVYTPNDYKKFLNTLSGLGDVIKTNYEFGGALGFNGDTLEGLLYSAPYTEVDTKSGAVSEEGYAYAYIERDENTDNGFLTFGKEGQSILESGEKVEPKLAFRTIEGGGTRYIYEAKVRFNSGEMEGSSWHTRFSMYNGNGRFWYMLAYTDTDGKLRLGSLNEPIAILDPGVWYTLRFEYYTDSAIAATDKVCMVYLDGKYIGDGGTSGSAGKDTALAYSYIEYRCQATNLSWSLDDVNTTTDDESYIAPPPPDFNDATGKYYTDAAIKKTRYDYDAEGVMAPILVNNNGSAYTSVVDGTLVFGKATDPAVKGEDAILFKNALGDAFWKYTNKTSIVEFDLNYSDISATTPMKWRFGKDIVVSKSGDSLLLSYTYGGEPTSINLGTKPDEWNNIRLEQYWYKQNAAKVTYTVVKVYVNNEYKGEFRTDYNSATDKFYIYLLSNETSASLTIDNLLFAHVDKAFVSGAETDTPDVPDTPDTEYTPTAEVLDVKGGANGIVVIMHDDGYISSANLLDKLFEKYDIKGNVALLVNNVVNSDGSPRIDTVNSWKLLINSGRWDITNHSYTHTFWGTENNAATLEKEIVTSGEILRALFETRRVLTFAYPGFSAKVAELGKEAVYAEAQKLCEQYYIGSRDYEGRTSAFGDIVWYDVNSCSIGEGWAGSAMTDIGTAAAGGNMAVIFCHRVVETAEEAEADTSATTVAKMEEIVSLIASKVEEGKVWNAFFEEAILYLREADTAALTVSGDAASVKLILTDTLDDSTYNYPLTVRLEVPASWSYVKVTQGENSDYYEAYALGNKSVVDIELVPDGGEAYAVAVDKYDVPAPTTPTLPKEEYLENPDIVNDGEGVYYSDGTKDGDRYDYDNIVTPLPSHNKAGGTLQITDGGLLFKKAEAAGEDYIMFEHAVTADEWKYSSLHTVLEFDFKFGSISAATPFKVRFGGNSSCDFALTVSKGYILINGTNTGIKADEWANVRFESFYKSGEVYTKIYVNDLLRYDAKSADTYAVSKVYFYFMSAEKSADAYMMLDNLYFGRFDEEYEAGTPEEFVPPAEPETPVDPTPDPEPETPTEPETPETPETPTDADATGKYYLSDAAGKRWDYDTITEIDSSMKSYSGTTGTYSIVDGALLLDDGDAESSAMAMKYYVSAPASYNAAVLEFDFKLTQSYGSYPIQIKLAGITHTIYYSKNYDASYGTGYKLCMKVDGADVPLGVNINEWANIRFEHYYEQAVLKVYVNNEFVYEIATSAGSADTATVYLTSNERSKTSNADLYLDNVYSGYLTLTYTEESGN